jgi:hypothetical protein
MKSRQDSPRRRLSNFRELAFRLERAAFGDAGCTGPTAGAARLNVTRPSFGEMTFAEQIRAWSESDVVIAPRGAHGASAVFMRPGALLVEIMPPCRSEDWEVHRIAKQRGVFVAQVRGQKPDGSNCRPDPARCRGPESRDRCLVDAADAEADFVLDTASMDRVIALAGCDRLAYAPGGDGLVIEALVCRPIC